MPNTYLLMWLAPWMLFLVRILVGSCMVPMALDVENPDKFDQAFIGYDEQPPGMRQDSVRAIRKRHPRCVANEYAPKSPRRRPASRLGSTAVRQLVGGVRSCMSRLGRVV